MRTAFIFSSLFVLVFSSSLVGAATVDLPMTGQTACYDEAGEETACEGTGQDGEIQAGVPWPSPRFSLGENCVRDNLTGLVWSRNANPAATEMLWEEALYYANNFGGCGYDDWRLPNINELESLTHWGETITSVWLTDQGFTGIVNDYWSSTTHPVDPGWALVLNLTGGGTGNGTKTLTRRFVWPVRGATSLPAKIWRTGQTTSYAEGDDGHLEEGEPWPSPRFTDHSDDTVTDELTGLMWTKDANAPGPSACVPGQGKSWVGAFTYIDCLNSRSYIGYTDWRLPNIREMRSLVDYSRSYPAVPEVHPFINVQSDLYRTSDTTLYLLGDYYAWSIDFRNSHITNNWHSHALRVWPVRGGTLFHTLTIAQEGSGAGTVTSVPAGIHCAGECTYAFAHGTEITLTAVPDSAATFTGWSGAGCSGTGDCVFTMTADTTVTASFAIEMETQGTIGTQFTITGSDFGMKKGKVLLGTVAAKIAKDGWQTDSITCTVTKVPLPAGSYPSPFDIIIKPQPYKTVLPITLTNAFTVVNPDIDSGSADQHGAPGTEITLYGRFFSTKKGKVSIEYEQSGQIKKKNCPVRYWYMDPISGVSELRFVVPKGLVPGTYTLWLTNKVGSITTTFTIDP